VTHRHLLPGEIDQLLDDEVGFGVAPLKAHVHDCPECQARVEEARFVVDALEEIPHLAPQHTFADRVMAQVPVFVPWHVAARDSARRWLPQSRSARVTVGALAASVVSMLTIGMLWIATQTDVLVFATGVASDRVRELVTSLGRDVIATVFGEQAFVVIQQTGMIGIAIALFVFLGTTVGAVAGLRALAAASSRRRG
jgi:anti-sigma factor RsiW